MIDQDGSRSPGTGVESPPDLGMDEMPTPILPRLMAAFRGSGQFRPGRWFSNRWVRLAVAVAVVAVVLIVGSKGIVHVRENEVGVLVNNLTGDLDLRESAGYHLFFPYVKQMYVLDKTRQVLDLSFAQKTQAGASRDLKLRTSDGSTVSLDMTVNFRLVPERAVEVLRRSGPGMRFADTWIEPFTRHVCFSEFGQLTSEEMYDAAKRNKQVQAAAKKLNDELGPHGIEIVSLTPGEFRFYKEYERVIQEKKQADQEAEKQQAQARAALQEQETQLVEATKHAATEMAAAQGECSNQLIKAKAEAEKAKREGDGKYAATILAADANFYSATKQATGQLALLLSEAEGTEKMRQALAGDGGLSMIGMEYAKRLSQIRFSATPIARDPWVQQFSVQPGTAAATGAALPAPAPMAPAASPGTPAPPPAPPGIDRPTPPHLRGQIPPARQPAQPTTPPGGAK